MSMPNSRRNLDIAIERLAKDSDEAVRIRRTMANAIVGQLLPDGAVKGGSSLKLRFGDGATRFSRDLDTARASDIESYVERLEDTLASGWNGFTGKLVPGKPAKQGRAYAIRHAAFRGEALLQREVLDHGSS